MPHRQQKLLDGLPQREDIVQPLAAALAFMEREKK
jgi:hypothetical protein